MSDPHTSRENCLFACLCTSFRNNSIITLSKFTIKASYKSIAIKTLFIKARHGLNHV